MFLEWVAMWMADAVKKHLFFLVFLVWFCCFHSLAAAQGLFEEKFDRPDSLDISQGWLVLTNDLPCEEVEGEISEDHEKDGAVGGNKENVVPQANRLFSEISREIEDVQKKNDQGKSWGSGAEIKNGMLHLHFGQGQIPVMVQRVINKKVTRLSFDLTPLYTMGGLDDRAWMGVKIYYLDHEDRILGEIRHFYYNSVFGEFQNSDTIHSTMIKGGFDGNSHHMVVDAGGILGNQLMGVDGHKIARTRISFEVYSNQCGATAEGYLDNIQATLEDAAGLMRFTREEMAEVVRLGGETFATKADLFPKAWVDLLLAKFGKEKLAAWLKEIPPSARNNPGELLGLVQTLYGFSGREAFETAFTIQLLLHAL